MAACFEDTSTKRLLLQFGQSVHPRPDAVKRTSAPDTTMMYRNTSAVIVASGGRLVLATQDDAVLGLAVWRVLENTMFGRFLYVDDLVTDSALRSRGVGKALLSRCEAIAVELGCREFVLDSGVQRAQTHRFYFREGLAIRAFNFGKSLPVPSDT